MNRRIRERPSTAPSVGYQTLIGWLGRVARLDFTVFDEVKGERTATASAVLIVLTASITAGIGSWLWALQHDNFEGLDTAEVFVKTIIGGGLVQTAVWFLWVFFAQLVIARMFGAQVLFSELMRTMGLAFAPMYLSIFVGIAPLAVPFGVFSLALTFLMSNIAIEQASGVTTREATFANLAGFGIFLAFMGAASNFMEAGVFGGVAPGILFFSLDF